jgi:Sec7-like guanine-nucleotide exchange factor
VCYIVSFAIIMLNTSLHNKSARLGGGPFTYEKFVNSLNETIARPQMPDQNIIKVLIFIQ